MVVEARMGRPGEHSVEQDCAHPWVWAQLLGQTHPLSPRGPAYWAAGPIPKGGRSIWLVPIWPGLDRVLEVNKVQSIFTELQGVMGKASSQRS